MSYTEFLQHILDEANYIAAHSQELSKEELLTDETLKRAFVRSIEVIGEAVKRLPDEFRRTHPSIDWRAMAGTRDKLIHDYFGIDYDIVWDIVKNEIPELRAYISGLLA